MLRNRLPDKIAQYRDPVFGVNLRDSLEDLKPGEAERIGNCFYDGGTRKRTGSSALTTVSQGAFRGRGGTRVYPQTASAFRLVAFSTKVMTVSDAGALGTVTFTLTSDQDTHFANWSITDTTYLCNKSNTLCSISAGQAFATVTGVNIPSSPTMAVPFLDRLFAIQGDGVWSTNPRTDAVWSPNSSTWAVYRPSGGTGPPTALHLHSLTGNYNNPQAQLLIFQESSLTALVGNDFGDNVAAATPPLTWDAALVLLSPRMGTRSPFSLVTVPGVGTFWFTQDANVAWLSFDSSVPKLIADKLFSNRTDIDGTNDVNRSQLGQVRMRYHDRKLKLYLPVGSNGYSTVQYWLDVRQLQAVPALADLAKLSWSGPHTGQSLSEVWVESSGSDADALRGCEGDTTVGLYVYTLNPSGVFTDRIGSVSQDVEADFRTTYHDFGAPSYDKWMPLVRFDASGSIENATVTLKDLHGNAVDLLTITKIDGTAFTTNRYGTSVTYNGGFTYGATVGQSIGQTDVASQSTEAMFGDAIQVQIRHTNGNFVLNNILPQVQVRRTIPVS
jgi:hypothetical protein